MNSFTKFSDSLYTKVLFQNDVVTLSHDVDTDQYSVRALSPIKAGTLILLEHVLSQASTHQVATSIAACPTLRTKLFPRTKDAMMATSLEDRTKYATEILKKNAFNFSGKTVIGAAFSMFNHSCIPNCHMDIADKIECKRDGKSILVDVYGMWTHRSVNSGEELTIDYVNGGGEFGAKEIHTEFMRSYGFNCTCDDKFISQASRRAEIHKNIGTAYRNRDLAYINMLTDKYIKDCFRFPKAKRNNRK